MLRSVNEFKGKAIHASDGELGSVANEPSIGGAAGGPSYELPLVYRTLAILLLVLGTGTLVARRALVRENSEKTM